MRMGRKPLLSIVIHLFQRPFRRERIMNKLESTMARAFRLFLTAALLALALGIILIFIALAVNIIMNRIWQR